MGRLKYAIERDIEESYILNFDRIDSYKSDHIDYFDKHFPCIEEDYSEEPEKKDYKFLFWRTVCIGSATHFFLSMTSLWIVWIWFLVPAAMIYSFFIEFFLKPILFRIIGLVCFIIIIFFYSITLPIKILFRISDKTYYAFTEIFLISLLFFARLAFG